MFAFIRERVARGLWQWSWPARFIGILKDDATATSILEELREDEAAFAALCGQSSLGSHAMLCQKRHVFQQRVVKQLLLAAKECEYLPAEDLKSLALSRAKANIATQLIEDMNGEQQNVPSCALARSSESHSRAWQCVSSGT